jgi:hypothetical protein
VGLFAIGCSIALLSLGKMIDQYPVGDETKRIRSISSPIETTKISVTLFWVLFFAGSWSVLQGTRILLILGITTLFAICLFMFTALAFSFAVLSTLRGRRKQIGIPSIQIPPDNLPATPVRLEASQASDVVIRSRISC